MRRAAASVAVAVLLFSSAARAGDPAQVWRTLETEHFHIHYYTLPNGKGEERSAQRLAVVAEDARKRLVPYLGPGLKRKTHVVLSDTTDDYNGFAGVYPYPAITVLATSPDDRAELNDYDDWLEGLFLHEYTHILHTGTIGGPCAWVVNALLGWGLGIIYAPNQAQPRFILEGLAVFEESERTSGGRLRNAIWDMYLRAATLEGRFERLDQFTHVPIQFPQGNSHYLYGSAFMRYVAAHYGQESLKKMSYDYGSSCIPGGINRTIRHATGKTWMQLYTGFRADMERRYRAQRDAIRQRGETPARHLTPFRAYAARPSFTPDGKSLLFVDDDGYVRQRIARLDLQTGKEATEYSTDAAGGTMLSPDGRWLVFHQEDVWHTVYSFNDVYLMDRTTREVRRLTHGLRATNPAISPDGKNVVFEVNESTARGLGLIRLSQCSDDDCPVELLIPPADFEQVYTPVFSPDGRTIAFSWWRTGGFRDLYLMDLSTRAITRLTDDRALDLEPRYSPDGRMLYFVNDRTGVYNLYAYEVATQKLYQATNVVNGVFDPVISPDGKRVAFVGFVADGYDLEIADLDRASWREADPALLDRSPSEAPPLGGKPLPSHAYNPFPTVLPWQFRPFAQPDGYGELIGISLTGSDAVGRHSWALSIAGGTGRADDWTFSGNYSYDGIWPSLSMGVGHALARQGGLVVNGKDIGYDQDSWTFGTGIGLPILRHIIDTSDIYISYNWSYLRNVSGAPVQDPSATITQRPYTGTLAGFGFSWSFQNLRRFLYSVSPESGRDVGISLGVGLRLFGSDHDTYALSWHWNEYLPMPWRPHWLRNHVLWLGYAGGVSGGEDGHRSLFVLGGYPQQNLLQSIYDFSRPGSATLRGYPYGSQVGDQFHVFNLEYRFPIAWIERGFQTFPLYLRRLHAKAFVDYGGAFFGPVALDKLKVGVGGELMLEIYYAWYYPAALQLGYAHGFNAGGGDQVYFLLNNPF